MPHHYGCSRCYCYPAKVTFSPVLQPIKAGTRFSDPIKMPGGLIWFALLHTKVVNPPEDGHPFQY